MKGGGQVQERVKGLMQADASSGIAWKALLRILVIILRTIRRY